MKTWTAIVCAALVVALIQTGCSGGTQASPQSENADTVRRFNGHSEITRSRSYYEYEMCSMLMAVTARTATILPNSDGLPRFVWLVDENGRPLETPNDQ